MNQIVLDETALKRGRRAFFGVCAGVFVLVLLEIADDPLPGVVLGLITAGAGAVLLFFRLGIDGFLCVSLIAAGFLAAIYGLDMPVTDDLSEVLLEAGCAAYFLFGGVNAVLFAAGILGIKR